MKRAGLVALALVLLAPAAANAQAPAWTIRYHLSGFIPTDEFEQAGPGGTSRATFQNAIGVGLLAEYQWTEGFGVELGVRYFKPEVRSSGPGVPTAEKKIDVYPLTLAALWHFDAGAYRLHLGPALSYVMFGSFGAPNANTKIEDELTLGARFGVETDLSAEWAFSGAFEYLATDAEIEGSGAQLQPSPVVISLGVAYRF